jgi:hypothetical protein
MKLDRLKLKRAVALRDALLAARTQLRKVGRSMAPALREHGRIVARVHRALERYEHAMSDDPNDHLEVGAPFDRTHLVHDLRSSLQSEDRDLEESLQQASLAVGTLRRRKGAAAEGL